MPLILIIIGLAVALGFGGFMFMQEPQSYEATVVSPAARVEDSTTTASNEPDTTVTTPFQTTPSSTPTSTPNTKPVADTKPVPTPVAVTEKPPISTQPTPKPVVPATTYKNGSYTITTSYTAPGRSTHTVTANITVANDVVTASDINYGGDSVDTSTQYQNRFSAKYQTLVVGKKLDEISLSRVGGASLTTGAFNKALAEVKVSARS